MPAYDHRHAESAFSLVEIMVSLCIVAFGMITLLGVLTHTVTMSNEFVDNSLAPLSVRSVYNMLLARRYDDNLYGYEKTQDIYGNPVGMQTEASDELSTSIRQYPRSADITPGDLKTYYNGYILTYQKVADNVLEDCMRVEIKCYRIPLSRSPAVVNPASDTPVMTQWFLLPPDDRTVSP